MFSIIWGHDIKKYPKSNHTAKLKSIDCQAAKFKSRLKSSFVRELLQNFNMSCYHKNKI